MLPGFRFLFAAIVLSMSILVFGLGAAALLRAAHEEFASNPSWRAPPETMFAQQAEATRPVLAMLRIEPPAAAQKAPDNVPAVAARAALAAIVQQPAVPEATKPEIPASESRAQSETTSARADARVADTAMIAAPVAETKVALTGHAPPPAQIFSPANEAAPLAAEPAAPAQTSTQASPEIDAASTKIATLGDPPVTIEPPPAKAVSENPDGSAVKKRLEARRAAHRRKVAARARLAAQQAQQQSFGLFGQPSAPPPAAARR
jgi:hypothetical protein